MARLLNTGGGGLYLCEPELDQVRCLVSYNTPLDFTGTVLKYGEGAAGLVAETGLPLMIDDYSTWAGHAEVYNGEKYFNAVISVPIKWQDEVIGVIHALAYDDRRFNENDLNLMLSFANQAAIAIHNVRLYTLSQQELAERKRISDALQTAEEKYRRLVEQVPAAIYIDTGDDYGTKTYISPQIEKISGYPAQAWIMDPLLWSKAIHPEDRERVLAENIRTNRTGEMFDIEYRLIQSTGQITWVREEAVLIHAPDDGTPVWHGMIADIAERKQTEEALRESEERFSNAFEFAPIGKALVSLDGRWLKVNQALCTLIGYSKEEMISKTFQEITHPEDLETDLSYVNQMLAGQIVSYQMEKRYIHKSGDIVWVLLSVSLVKERDGKPLYFISQIQNITQRKNAEQEISRRAKETSALLETSLALTNLDLKAILQDIGNSAKNLFAADGCRIFLMQPDGESLRCVLALQESPEAFLHLIVKPGQGVTGAVAASGQAEIVNEMQNDPRAVPVPGTDEEDEALMFAPLKERDRTIGVLSIRRNGIDRPFQPDDLEFLEAFASMAASAVSNARLFEETQRRLAELEALYENGLAVSQLLEPHQIGDRIIETFSRHLSWHHVAIRLLNPGMDELDVNCLQPAWDENGGKKEIEHRFNSLINRVGQGMSGLVVQTGQSIPYR